MAGTSLKLPSKLSANTVYSSPCVRPSQFLLPERASRENFDGTRKSLNMGGDEAFRIANFRCGNANAIPYFLGNGH